MSIPEQAGKAIDALKGSPGLLVLVLLQVATLALIYFAVEGQNARRHERELLLLRNCFSIERLPPSLPPV